ncbi:MAG: ribbon-helix-helix domain-containing protein [Rhodospirillales bacterium]
MTVKSSISLTDSQDAFVRTLVAEGRYPSVSAALQQGLELLRLKTQGEEAEVTALRELLSARREGAFVSGASMKDRISAIADKKRGAHDV